MANKKLIELCKEVAIYENNPSIKARKTLEALNEMQDSLTSVFLILNEKDFPATKTMKDYVYADLFFDQQLASEYAEKDCIATLMFEPKDTLNLLYKANVNLLIVHIDENTVTALDINKDYISALVETNGIRPEINHMSFEIERMLAEGASEDVLAPLVTKLYEEIGHGGFYLFKNRRNGLYFKDPEGTIVVYSDILLAQNAYYFAEAQSKFGVDFTEIAYAYIEEFAIGEKALILNETIVIPEEVIKYAIITTPTIEKAKAFVAKMNNEHKLQLDAEDLLARLLDYPEMYKTFLTGITDDLNFVGGIPFSAEGYSGNVLLQVTTGGNAAAAFSIIERLKTDPATFRPLFETGQLKY